MDVAAILFGLLKIVTKFKTIEYSGGTTPTGHILLSDCGHNATTNWRPSDWIVSGGLSLETLLISNLDEDHREIVLQRLQVGWLVPEGDVPIRPNQHQAGSLSTKRRVHHQIPIEIGG